MKFEIKYWTPLSGSICWVEAMEAEYTTITIWAHSEEHALEQLNLGGRIRLVYIKQIN
tara:strand:+ start:104 stop:277 length:174 start_codon:yes stop_codon:yes gene_type:complete